MAERFKNKISISTIAIAVIMVIALFVSSNIKWGKNRWNDIYKDDAKGYYSYLPAVFIYHDLNFNFYDSIENKHFLSNIFDYRKNINNIWINKYYCGTAVCQAPLFILTYAIGTCKGHKYDGYEKPFAIAISISTLIFLLISLFFLKKFLELYEIKKWDNALVLLASVFGTNALYYVTESPGMSHIYSMAFVCLFLFSAKKYFISFEKKYFLWLLFSSAFIFLIRPINLLIALSIPVLAGDIKTLKFAFNSLIKNKLSTLLSLIIFLIIISIQFIIYKIASGHFVVYSYSNEGFKFTELNIINFLFSYKKGLFLYEPLLFVSLICGSFYLWKVRKYELLTFFIFFFVTVYVLSSWWMWWYGGSFGCRVFIEFIPMFALMLGISLNSCKNRKWKITLTTTVIVLILFTQIQLYQYHCGLIHWEDMNYERYWNVFMRVDKLF